MNKQVLLCLDERSYQNPEFIGLDGEVLDAQDWLMVSSIGQEARSALNGNSDVEEIWVVSCEDVEPINLAATLKADRPDLCVRLVTSERCGSLYSRAYTALIDEVLELKGFVRRYAEVKRHAAEERKGSKVVLDLPPMAEGNPRGLHGAGSQTAHAGQPGNVTVIEAPSRPDAQAGQAHVDLLNLSDMALQTMTQEQIAPVRRKGFIMPVVSGSGGSGKSSIAVISAQLAANRGLRTLLLDYDLQFGDVAHMCGEENALEIDIALEHPDRLDRELSQNAGLAILAAPSRIETAEAIAQSVPQLIDKLVGRFDVIIANTGATWGEQHAALLERSSVALFLIDQRMSSVRACQHALELCSRCGIATSSFRFALNRCAKGAPLTSMDVSNALQGAPVLELRDGGRDVEDCLSGGAVQELVESGNELVQGIDRLLDQVLPDFAMQAPIEEQGGSVKVVKRRGRHAGRKRGRRTI